MQCFFCCFVNVLLLCCNHCNSQEAHFGCLPYKCRKHICLVSFSPFGCQQCWSVTLFFIVRHPICRLWRSACCALFPFVKFQLDSGCFMRFCCAALAWWCSDSALQPHSRKVLVLSQLSADKAGVTPWTGCQFITGPHRHTNNQFAFCSRVPTI